MPYSISTGSYEPTSSWHQPSKWSAMPDLRIKWPNVTPGHINAGPTLAGIFTSADQRAFSVFSPKQPLADILESGGDWQKAMRMGTVELDALDPWSSLAQATGPAVGIKQPLVGDQGSVFDPGAFLASKDIDLFGGGFLFGGGGDPTAGGPSRLLDYALAPYLVLARNILGMPQFEAPGGENQPDLPYAFQRDPAYWKYIEQGGDPDSAAKRIAARYVDPDKNPYIVERIAEQIRKDQEKTFALTSGDEAIDFVSMKAAPIAQRLIAQGEQNWADKARSAVQFGSPQTGWTKIPLVGTAIGKLIGDVTPEERAAWEALSPYQRSTLAGSFALPKMINDLVPALILLPGAGQALSVARASGGIVGTLAAGGATGMKLMTYAMSAGLATALANWSLEAVWPAYGESVGKEIDAARPVSGSVFNAVINEAGFWTSGTFGAYTLGQGAVRIGERVGLQVGKGSLELGFYARGLGGARVRDAIVRSGAFTQDMLDLAAKQTFLSEMKHVLIDGVQEKWDAWLASKYPDSVARALDRTGSLGRVQLINEQMARLAESIGPSAEAVLRASQIWRLGRPTASLADKFLNSARLFKWADDAVASRYLSQYGEGWMLRRLGSTETQALKDYARSIVERRGGDFSRLEAGTRTRKDWEWTVRQLHNADFMDAVVRLDRASEGAREANKAFLVANEHVWLDQLDETVAVLRGEDREAAQELATRLARTTKEGDEFVARHWNAGPGVSKTAETVDPGALATYLQDIEHLLLSRRTVGTGADLTMPLNALNREIDDIGSFAIAYRQLDRNGNPFSHVVRGNKTIRAPWVDYLDTMAEGVELGNRGMIGRMYDSMFRGYRTWRLTQTQEAMLYRRLDKYGFTSAQIADFHSKVLGLAARAHVNPQMVGRFPRWWALGENLSKEVEATAGRIFGAGPFRNARTGLFEVIDWRAEIGKAYRQAYTLNGTAGVTSFIKGNFGPVGEAITVATDFLYPFWRFTLSPLFKLGEVAETLVFNGLKGVNPFGDPYIEAIRTRPGFGNNHRMVAQEQAFDMVLQGAQGTEFRLPGQAGSDLARQQTAYRFAASHLPEDTEAVIRRANARAYTTQWAERYGGDTNAYVWPDMGRFRRIAENMLDPQSGAVLPGHEQAFMDLMDLIDGRMTWDDYRLARRVVDGDPAARPAGLTLDENIDALMDSGAIDQNYIPHYLPGEHDRGLFHVTTQASGVLDHGLQARLTRYQRLWDDQMLNAVEDALGRPSGALGFDIIDANGNPARVWSNQGRAWDLDTVADLRKPPSETGGRYTFDTERSASFNPQAHYRGSRASVEVHGGQVRSVLTEEADGTIVTLWEREGPNPTVQAGLGMNYPDNLVSITYDYEHAVAIQRRLRQLVTAANGQYDGMQLFRELWDEFVPLDRWWRAHHNMTTDDASMLEALYGNLDQRILDVRPNQKFKLTQEAADAWLQDVRRPWPALTHEERAIHLTEWFDRYAGDPGNSFTIIQGFDSELMPPSTWAMTSEAARARGESVPATYFGHVAVIGADPAMFRQLDPNDIQILDVGIAHPERPGYGRGVNKGPDTFELQIPEERLFVIDPREPIDFAGDVDGLLRQMQALSDEAGNPLPGTQVAHEAITRRIERIRDAVEPRSYVEDFSHIPGTPEYVLETAAVFVRRQRAKFGERSKQLVDLLVNPVPWKESQAEKLLLKDLADDFPEILRLGGADEVVRIFEQSGIPENRWLDTLMLDRELWEKWAATGDPADFQRMLDLWPNETPAGGRLMPRRAFLDNEFYDTEDWQALVSLMYLSARAMQADAFAVHFFSPWRSYAERTLNHPVMGIYPLSWAYKATKQWFTFLFNNRTWKPLHLGMAPAVALQNLTESQNQFFRLQNDADLEKWQDEGPLSSTFFVANLIMPGDWSSLPFPLSRTIRELVRGNTNPFDIARKNFDYLGLSRDLRLFDEMAGEWGNVLLGGDPQQQVNLWTIAGEDTGQVRRASELRGTDNTTYGLPRR